jgi:hypothetical protein
MQKGVNDRQWNVNGYWRQAHLFENLFAHERPPLRRGVLPIHPA